MPYHVIILSVWIPHSLKSPPGASKLFLSHFQEDILAGAPGGEGNVSI